jgi:hypothetical protein
LAQEIDFFPYQPQNVFAFAEDALSEPLVPMAEDSPCFSQSLEMTKAAAAQTRGRKKETRKFKNMSELLEGVSMAMVDKWRKFDKMNTNETRRKDSLKRTYFRYIKEFLTTLINFRFKEGELRHSSITLAGI